MDSETAVLEIETDLRAAVASRVGEAKYGLWFGDGVRLGVDGDNLVVGVPNGFFREWIDGHFAGNLVEAADRRRRPAAAADLPSTRGRAAPGRRVPASRSRRRTRRPGPASRCRPPDELPAAPDAPRTSPPSPSGPPARPIDRRPAAPARRLEDFVTGPGNRLAHAAAARWSRSPRVRHSIRW